ncbi:MAG: diguanylate cyclase [Syntrophobacterales bacterium]|nr:diguanylate cyclase [Syntrophobacterales bacterium]
MSIWLQGQLDYIFFFYGLAFICLGAVSYILTKEGSQRLPWIYLAGFGLIHGINEWLDLLALRLPPEVWFTGLRAAVLALSFLCLVEFGRVSGIRRQGRGPGRWVPGVLLLGAGLGGLAGWSGLNAATRYALGLVGSLWAGWALYEEGQEAGSRGRPWLTAGAAGFLVYGLAAGLVVPAARFFPASLVNYETFTGLTGLPIQLVRGVLAVGIAAMISVHFQVSRSAEYEGSTRHRSRFMLGLGLALSAILISGWFLTQFLGQVARDQIRKDGVGQSKIIIQRLTFELGEAEEAVKALSGSPWIGPVLESKSAETLARANSVLDRYQQRFGASVAYLLDKTGTTIASSNRGAPDSFVGQSYAFRPYFQKAMAGQTARHFALGVTSKKRGFYASHPVRDQEGKIVGVAVLKMTLDKFQQDLRNFDPAFLIDPQGVVFAGSRPYLDYQNLWPSAPGPQNGKAAAVYTESVFPEALADGADASLDGNHYLLYRQDIDALMAPGWTLVFLAPVHLEVLYRSLGIALAFILVVLILVAAGSNLSIREGANRVEASEARFRAMFAAAPEAVFVYDPENRKVLDANPFMAQWLGYTPAELVNLNIDELVETGEDAAADLNGPACMLHRRYRRRDGTPVDVEITGAKIFYGQRIQELVFVRDVTARKRAEAELAWEATVNASIAELSRTLLTALPLEEIASLVHDRALRLTDSNLGFAGYINPQTGDLVIPEMTGEVTDAGAGRNNASLFEACRGLCGWVLKHHQPLIINDPQAGPRSMGTLPIRRFLSVPAIIEDRLVGQIALADAGREYTRRDQEICERLALLYAMAIHRQRLDETLRESERGLKTILDNVQTGVLIIDPETQSIVDANPVAVKLMGSPKDKIVGSPRQRFIRAPQNGSSPISDLDDTVADTQRILLRGDGGSRWIIQTVVPISLQGKGYLLENFVDITERRQWEEAVQTANDKLHAAVSQVEEQNRTMTLASEMADILQSCQTSEEAYAAISHFMPRFFPSDSGALYILNNSRNLFEATAGWGLNAAEVSVFAPDECWSVRRGRVHKVTEAGGSMICRHVSEAIPGGYMCVPLIAQGETLGIFHLRAGSPTEDGRPELTAAKEQLALTVAEDMALALANLKLRETLRSQAIRDPLTGLFNRRYMEETLVRELNRVKRLGTNLGVIMMDLDQFKLYNDTFGHHAGDELLSTLGAQMKSLVREEDIACRYGGEEFLLIMPGASEKITLERAEILRQAVKEMHRNHRGQKPATLSLGVAVYPDHGDTELEIIQAADVALYRAKQEGRDRVRMAATAGTIKKTSLKNLSPPHIEVM